MTDSMGFETLKALLEKAQQAPLEAAAETKTTIDGVEWRVLRLLLPDAPGQGRIPPGINASAVIAAVYYRSKGAVEAQDVIRIRDRSKATLLKLAAVVAAAEGFTPDAMKVFRRSKHIDYISETHWPKIWPRPVA